MKARRNGAMRDAMRRALSANSPAARDLAYTMAECQRAVPPRTSPGYEAFMRSGARRKRGGDGRTRPD